MNKNKTKQNKTLKCLRFFNFLKADLNIERTHLFLEQHGIIKINTQKPYDDILSYYYLKIKKVYIKNFLIFF